jgi:hypothetical protein
MAEIDAEKQNCFISLSPSGWANNELGLEWLEQVFERSTKQIARLGRDWRLLILDGHSSHLTFDILEYCESKRILLCMFLPNLTHTLHPLDAVCFKPLSGAYTHQPLKQGNFIPLFWAD